MRIAINHWKFAEIILGRKINARAVLNTTILFLKYPRIASLDVMDYRKTTIMCVQGRELALERTIVNAILDTRVKNVINLRKLRFSTAVQLKENILLRPVPKTVSDLEKYWTTLLLLQ
jgi:hypothetical protein